MEEKKVFVSYEGSGVKTLRGFGYMFIVLAAISALMLFVVLVLLARGSDYAALMAVYAIVGGLFSCVFGALLLGLSGIAKTALYQRTLLEEEHEFENCTRRV
jgi:hypothetical protein